MAKNTPDPTLCEKSVVAIPGEVDAFLSHSWSDDAHDKWAALSEWRNGFRAANSGREPTIWIGEC